MIAGQNSKQGQWPWQIAMLKNGRFSCGGSLIYPQWVVTAAHCVPGARASTIKVVLGKKFRILWLKVIMNTFFVLFPRWQTLHSLLKRTVVS